MAAAVDRRSFIKMFFTGLFSAIMGKFTKTSAAVAGSDIFLPRQIITGDSRSTRMIMWHSRYAHNSLMVNVRDKAGQVRSYAGGGGWFQDDGEAFYINKVFINNLQPASQYTYQMVRMAPQPPGIPCIPMTEKPWRH